METKKSYLGTRKHYINSSHEIEVMAITSVRKSKRFLNGNLTCRWKGIGSVDHRGRQKLKIHR